MSGCTWCEDTREGHAHYAVLGYEDGKLLGRLAPDGSTTRRNIHALVLSKARAESIATEINEDASLPTVTAKVVRF